MKHAMKRLASYTPKLLLPPALALRRVTSKSGKGVYASSDTLFKGAVFGRDSLEVGEDLLTLRPRLVRRIILTLASLQGDQEDSVREEELGKIIHEYRTERVDGRQLKGVPKHIFDELSARWGGDNGQLTYYGSVDATPLFVRLVAYYCRVHGTNIMHEQLKLRSGTKISLHEVTKRAIAWLDEQVMSSKSGLVEYQRKNPHGIENQVWKDSREFYVHEDGTLANHHRPIASIEVQGLAYDAFRSAAELFSEHRDQYVQKAKDLRDKTIELLWLEDKHYFALGTDYDESGKLRIIETITANPAELLDTSFFDELPAYERQHFITGIVKTIMSKEFLTDAGIRSRALGEAKLVNYWDYHGSYVTWPKETHDIAKGLRRQGFLQLAKQLENRLLNLIRRSKSYLEFAYVDEWGRVMAGPPSSVEHGEITIIDSTNNPEGVQAWTVSAVVQIVAVRLRERRKRRRIKTEPWQHSLEQQILRSIPKISRLLVPGALAARYPEYPYKVVKEKSKVSTDMPAR